MENATITAFILFAAFTIGWGLFFGPRFVKAIRDYRYTKNNVECWACKGKDLQLPDKPGARNTCTLCSAAAEVGNKNGVNHEMVERNKADFLGEIEMNILSKKPRKHPVHFFWEKKH